MTNMSNKGLSCYGPACTRDAYSRGLCRSHYAQMNLGKDLTPLKLAHRGCKFPACSQPHDGLGLCQGHRRQQAQGKTLTELRAWSKDRACSCGKQHHARGLCLTCYTKSEFGRQSHKDAVHRRRARLRHGDHLKVSLRDWTRIVNRYQGLCAYCQVSPYEHQDHVIPISKGGRHSIGNLLPACSTCNLSKNASFLAVWRAK